MKMNTLELIATIKLEGLTMKAFLKKIGMSSSTWSKKIRGMSEFTRAEIQKIIQVLNLNEAKTMSIFFSVKVS